MLLLCGFFVQIFGNDYIQLCNHYNITLISISGMFRSNALFIGPHSRKAVAEGRADCIPIFLGEIPLLFRRNIFKVDVALISLSPPDQHGFCSLGPGVDCTRAAVQNARYIIGL